MIANIEGQLPIAVADAATLNDSSLTTAEVDTVQGGIKYDFATFLIRTGTIASGASLSVLKVQESDESGSGFTDAVDAGSSAVGDANDDGWVKITVDCRSKKRYLDLVATAAGSANLAIDYVVCILSRGQQSPVDDSNFVNVTRG